MPARRKNADGNALARGLLQADLIHAEFQVILGLRRIGFNG
jgi:hypothetical protein